ncbi:MAG TPA: hypothetical protein P5560_04020 [Thermotogota bacterium]|nr:hypothetical protein [Thermotogota bacterium]HRW92098.1 hypothetical protein [Thermotogota bacterium]
MKRTLIGFIAVFLLVSFLTSCATIQSWFLNVGKIGSTFSAALSSGMAAVVPEPLIAPPSEEGFRLFREAHARNGIPTAVTTFVDKYVHLAAGVSKTSDTYEIAQEMVWYMFMFYKKSTFIHAEKWDFPASLASSRGGTLFGTKPSYIEKGILVDMSWQLDPLIMEDDLTILQNWPLLLIENTPYMFTITRGEEEGDLPPFYPYPLNLFVL